MKEYIFTIEWLKGSINDNLTKFFKQNNIDYFYNHFGKLVTDLYGIGQLFTFDYEKIKNNLYGIKAIEYK